MIHDIMLRSNFRLSAGFSCGIIILVLMMSSLPPITYAQTSNLPELGDAATRYLSPDDEVMIGKRFFRQLMKSPRYIADPELRHYLNTLGRNIGLSADLGGLTLHFNLIRENQLNAFAVPGGYITFNSGLLLTTENESELASVIGHEIAHLSQRHLPRLVAKTQASQLPTLAAVLASILIGGQAGVAGVTMANATHVSDRLAYNRELEREADAIGIDLMAKSGFDPRATASFFEKLQQFSFLTQKDLPEFLRTHPLSYTRIAESEARIKSYPPIYRESSLDFHLARARIEALYGDPQVDTVRVLEDRINQSVGTERLAWRYGLSVALMEDRQFQQAKTLIEDVISELPGIPQILAARAEIVRQSGHPATAARTYGELVRRHPNADYLLFPYLEALLEAGDAKEAKKVIRHQLRHHPEDYEFYPLLSKVNVALDMLTEAHQADAEFHIALGDYEAALHSLKLALRENNNQSDYLTQAIQARIEEVEWEAGDKKMQEGQ